MLEDISKNEPLNAEHIQLAFHQSSRYLIPYNQSKSKQYGLIFFNTCNRPGAKQEADDLQEALEIAGSTVIKRNWKDPHDLQAMMDEALSGILSECSLLTVFLLSHGYMGALVGDNNHEIPVNHILHHLSDTVPKYVPMVSSV